MIRAQFSTTTIAQGGQGDAWREWYRPVFEITPSNMTGEDFPATNDVWDLGGLIISHVIAPPITMVRARANLMNAPVDHWVLGYCIRGESSIRTNSAALKAAPGSLFLWSLGEPCWGERSETDRVDILLPRDMFPEIGAKLDMMNVSVIERPSCVMLGEYMMALTRWLPNMEAGSEVRVREAVRNMISACLVPDADNIKRAEGDIRSFLIERVRRVIRKHLHSPSLGPEALCKLVGMSRSSLYRLFIYDGGIMHYIQRQRLLHAHALLSDPLNRQSIQSISDDLCFPDASSFSRAFRRAFGCSPRELRDAAAMGVAASVDNPVRDQGEIVRFADVLRVGRASQRLAVDTAIVQPSIGLLSQEATSRTVPDRATFV